MSARRQLIVITAVALSTAVAPATGDAAPKPVAAKSLVSAVAPPAPGATAAERLVGAAKRIRGAQSAGPVERLSAANAFGQATSTAFAETDRALAALTARFPQLEQMREWLAFCAQSGGGPEGMQACLRRGRTLDFSVTPGGAKRGGKPGGAGSANPCQGVVGKDRGLTGNLFSEETYRTSAAIGYAMADALEAVARMWHETAKVLREAGRIAGSAGDAIDKRLDELPLSETGQREVLLAARGAAHVTADAAGDILKISATLADVTANHLMLMSQAIRSAADRDKERADDLKREREGGQSDSSPKPGEPGTTPGGTDDHSRAACESYLRHGHLFERDALSKLGPRIVNTCADKVVNPAPVGQDTATTQPKIECDSTDSTDPAIGLLTQPAKQTCDAQAEVVRCDDRVKPRVTAKTLGKVTDALPFLACNAKVCRSDER